MDYLPDGYLMEHMTVRDMRQALAETHTAILPIGGVEQHGYHLPLSVDMHNAYEIAKRVAKRAKCVVAAPITYSFSGGELPGTVDISLHTMSLLITDVITSLANQGFRNVIVLLGHGGSENQRTVTDATEAFYRRQVRYRDIRIAMVGFLDLTPTIRECIDAQDYHAAYLETSLMLHWHPEMVRPREEWVTDEPQLLQTLRQDPDSYQVKTKEVDHPLVTPVTSQRPDMIVGVMGDPGPANAEFGKRVCEEAVGRLVKLVEDLERGL